jgi:hypothetical protein
VERARGHRAARARQDRRELDPDPGDRREHRVRVVRLGLDRERGARHAGVRHPGDRADRQVVADAAERVERLCADDRARRDSDADARDRAERTRRRAAITLAQPAAVRPSGRWRGRREPQRRAGTEPGPGRGRRDRAPSPVTPQPASALVGSRVTPPSPRRGTTATDFDIDTDVRAEAWKSKDVEVDDDQLIDWSSSEETVTTGDGFGDRKPRG